MQRKAPFETQEHCSMFCNDDKTPLITHLRQKARTLTSPESSMMKRMKVNIGALLITDPSLSRHQLTILCKHTQTQTAADLT